MRGYKMDSDTSIFIFFCRPQGVDADPHIALALPPEPKLAKEKAEEPSFQYLDEEMSIRIGRAGPFSGKPPFIYPHQWQTSLNISSQKLAGIYGLANVPLYMQLIQLKKRTHFGH